MSDLKKLEITDTFKNWRDKINELFERFKYVVTSYPDGHIKISSDSVVDMTISVPVYFEQGIQIGDTVINDSGEGTGTISANAASATKLQTARNINNTAFDGTKNITTAIWGTARNITVSDSDATNTGTAVSVNGSKNYNITLPATIKAEITGNSSTATTLKTARTINGTSFNGSANITTANWGTARNISIADADKTNTGTAVSVNGSAASTLLLPGTIKASLTGNSSSATKLQTARKINGIAFNGTADITNYGTCSTAAATADKVVAISNFNLVTGARAVVRFTVTNTAAVANLTLNINSTGAKSIKYRNGNLPAAGTLSANRTYEFVYDGTNYQLVGDLDANTDTKVTQTVTSTNAEYPLLASADANKTATSATTSRFATGITINPSTNSLTCAGTITGSKVFNAIWNDYAEFFEKGEDTQPGDIIALDEESETEQYIKATEASRCIVGVHSNTFGHILGSDAKSIKDAMKTHIPVGLAGRVYVKFLGIAKKGTKVVPSHIPGVGRPKKKTDTNDKIVGYLLEDSTSNTVSLLKMKII